MWLILALIPLSLFFLFFKILENILGNESKDYVILDDMSDSIRTNYKKLIPYIQGDRLLVIHRSRGVILELTAKDEEKVLDLIKDALDGKSN